MLGEGPTVDFNNSVGAAEQSTNFSKAKTNFAWVCMTIMVIVICLLTEIYKFKVHKESVNLTPQFCLGNISNGFSDIESWETSLKGNAYDFLMVDN